MTSIEIRNAFLEFFKTKKHTLTTSAPMVIKNDPTLMFTNAGMNQFKDFFLGNQIPEKTRVANSQKCLRVSGKHNDLDEVGHDTYHHTMFEMLGNWSFGDYFKEEAIDMAWEFLTQVMKIDKNKLYVTVFSGDKKDQTGKDLEAFNIWKKHLPEERILEGSKKDNFWEMGDSGPCGPCSEIHIDIRPENEKKGIPGAELINKDHPLVIEIWNLVFIQYNRKADGKLENLPNKHIDTGMGFERLSMVVQGKTSNYDTDIFQHIIKRISEISGFSYGENPKTDIAMRVIADHLRAIAFSIAEGQLPSNNKAGYVIRRILRRAVRYAYTFLNQGKPLIHKLVPELVSLMGNHFPELKNQQNIIEKVIYEEEMAFLRTLNHGISMLDEQIVKTKQKNQKQISGKDAFTLYDTYGFPLDLTQLILKENEMDLNEKEYYEMMEKQKSRSRQDAEKDTSDWILLLPEVQPEFKGYDYLETEAKIVKYREISLKNKKLYHIVLDQTPFYAESGGQVGDKGYLSFGEEKTEITDTKKENELIIHIAKKLPSRPSETFHAVVNAGSRINTQNNHTATHLLHHALRDILGDHVEQKGSLVHPDHLRFDFSHFQKVSDEEIRKTELRVNQKIRENIPLREWRNLPLEEARNMGAMALFGEKYGDNVRVIKFEDSIELCGGTHVESTGKIGFFKIIKESAIAAGIRRIEAITGEKAQSYIMNLADEHQQLQEVFPTSKNLVGSILKLRDDFQNLSAKLEVFENEKKASLKKELATRITNINGINYIGEVIPAESADVLKDLSFQLKGEIDNLFLVLGAEMNNKAGLSIMISDNLVSDKALNASVIIREIAREIKGGGGGQAFFATAGGKDPQGLVKAIEKTRELIENK